MIWSDDLSPDVYLQDRAQLVLTTNEIYVQYILLPEGVEDVEAIGITQDIVYGYEFSIVEYQEEKYLILKCGFGSSSNDCLQLVIISNNGVYYSNNFRVTADEELLERTVLVTHWHRENHYGIPYLQAETPQQIRFPFYFQNHLTEANSEEYITSTKKLNNVYKGRVERVFKKKWKVIAGDSINNRLAITSDEDFVYFNGIRQICDKYVYEETDGESDFSISTLVSQENRKDKLDTNLGLSILSAESSSLYVEYDSDSTVNESVAIMQLFENYNHFFNVPEGNLKVQITEIPIIGNIFNFSSNSFIEVGNEIDYSDFLNGNVMYFPEGMNGDYEPLGDFSVSLKFVIQDEYYNESEELNLHIIATDENIIHGSYDENFYESENYN